MHKNIKSSFLKLYFLQMKMLSVPAVICIMLSCIMVTYEKYIFSVSAIVYAILSFSYIYSRSKSDFIYSVSSRFRHIYFASIFSILTYGIFTFFALLLKRTLYSFLPVNTEFSGSTSPMALFGYLACMLLAISCIIIGFSLARNILTGLIYSAMIILLPRLILNSLASYICTYAPVLPMSELNFIFNSKLNLLNQLFLPAANNTDCSIYTNKWSVLYTFSLAVLYLIIGYALFSHNAALSSKSGIFLRFKTAIVNRNKKYITKISAGIIIITAIIPCMFFAAHLYCRQILNSAVPNAEEVEYIKLDSYHELSVNYPIPVFPPYMNTIYEYNGRNIFNYDSHLYANAFLTQKKITDKDTIQKFLRLYEDTLSNKNPLTNDTQDDLFYFQITIKTKNEKYSRNIRMYNEDYYKLLITSLYSDNDYKMFFDNMPSSDDCTYHLYGIRFNLTEDSYKKIYETYKDEIELISNNLTYQYPFESVIRPVSVMYIRATDISNKKGIYIDIPFTQSLPHTLSVIYEEYKKNNPDSITNLITNLEKEDYVVLRINAYTGYNYYTNSPITINTLDNSLERRTLSKEILNIARQNQDLNISNHSIYIVEIDGTEYLLPLSDSDLSRLGYSPKGSAE